MLKRTSIDVPQVPRNLRRERKLWHDRSKHTPSIGCRSCPDLEICGGLSIGPPLYDCLKFCCNDPTKCRTVCRNNADFADRVREISGFSFSLAAPMALGLGPALPEYIPILFHGDARVSVTAPQAAAFSLYAMLNRRNGSVRYVDHDDLCRRYKISHRTSLILTGTDEDPPLEHWWSLGEGGRRRAIRKLLHLGITSATTPNFSLFSDAPRWDDLHSMKRIQIVHREFLDEGLAAALHVNGRTDTDFKRWTEYVSTQTDITHLAYEFTTGTGWPGRREQHAAWLVDLAANVGRPLDLLVRGGIDLLPMLSRRFARVSFLDTSAFLKTMKRRRAVLGGNGRIDWRPFPTTQGAPLDLLFEHNLATLRNYVAGRLERRTEPMLEVASQV
jgi:hypothetical protein